MYNFRILYNQPFLTRFLIEQKYILILQFYLSLKTKSFLPLYST